MKKLLFAFPIIALLAAGCNPSQQAVEQNPPAQQSQVTPSPMQEAQQPTSTPPSSSASFKTVTNNVLNFSVSIPEEDHLAVEAITGKPVNYVYVIEDAHGQTQATGITIQMHEGKVKTDDKSFKEDFPFFIENSYYASFIKPFTTTNGYKTTFYNNPNPDPNQPSNSYGKIFTAVKEAVVIPYPTSSTQQIDTSLNTQLSYPLIAIYMYGGNTSFTAEQQNVFMKVVNSFKFTANSPAYNTTVDNSGTKSSPNSSTSTITLDAATKVAIVQAINNAYTNIFSSNDPAKIRNYFEIEKPNDSSISAVDDNMMLQVAKINLAMGAPEANLATDPAVTWMLNGNYVTITVNTGVSYHAILQNGSWY